MAGDLSAQNTNGAARRFATALLRANGGTTASLQMPPLTGDSTDAAQLGLNAPNFQLLPLSPVAFRRARITLQEGEQQKYELLISAEAVAAQVSQLELTSADLLFSMAAGVVVAGKLFLIEATYVSESQGEVYLYRLLLREARGEWQLQ